MKLSREKIEALRIRKNMERAEMYEKAGCTRQNFHKLLKRKKNWPQVVEKWADVFGVSVEEVAEEE